MLRFSIKIYLSFKKIREKYIWISIFTFRKLYLLWICREIIYHLLWNKESIVLAQAHTCWILWTEFINLSCPQSVRVHGAQCTNFLWAKTFFSMWHYDPLWRILHSARIVCLLYEQKHFLDNQKIKKKTFFSMWHYDPLWPILLCYVIEYV